MIKKIWTIVPIVVVFTFLIGGTLMVYYYSKGYRVNISQREIEKTGVLSVKTNPRRATIIIDGEEKGKSPKAVTGISEGEHTILIQKESYQDWTMTINVSAEQSIPIEATLFYEEPSIEIISLEDIDEYQINKIFFDQNNQVALFTILDSENSLLQVWGYPINRRFWELETSPYLITEFYTSEINSESQTPVINSENYDISISPNSQRALLQTNLDSTTSYFIFYTDRFVSLPTEMDDIRQTGSVAPSWSEDSQYIIFSKNNELRTLDVEPLVQTVIHEKENDEEFVWTSTDTSQIYFIENSDNDYSIKRIRASGNNESTVLENVSSLIALSYTDSPTENVHHPSDLRISDDGDFMIIMENNRMIVYSFKEDTFSTYPSENPYFVSFSTESEKFICSNGDIPNLLEYNLVVDEGDPIHTLGLRTILDIHSKYEPMSYKWLPEDEAILFSNKNPDDTYSIIGLSIDGLNENVAFNNSLDPKFAIGNSGKYIIAMYEGRSLCKITVRE